MTTVPAHRLPPEELDEEIRRHERAAYAHFGLDPHEEMLLVDTVVGERHIRVVHLGPDAAQLSAGAGVPDETGLPPVLVLHGIGSFSVLIAEMLTYLPGRTIIVVDWPGHGLSGPCELGDPRILRRLATSVIAGLLDELGIPVCDVLAHSLGGQFSLYSALALPDRIRRIALLGAPGAAFRGGRPIPPMLVMALPNVGGRVMARVSESTFTRFNDLALGPKAGPHLPDDVMTTGRLMANRETYGRSVSTYFRALIRGTTLRDVHHLSVDELSALPEPVLLCWGDLDVFQSPMSAADLIVAIRDHRLVRLPYAGHAPWLDEPEIVGRAVAEHLSHPDLAAGPAAAR